MYTEGQVRAAYTAWFVDKGTDYKGNIKAFVAELYGDYDVEYKQALFAEYDEGKKLLKDAKLIMTHRGIVVHDRPEVNSPLVAVAAGHIATNEAYRLVGLKKK